MVWLLLGYTCGGLLGLFVLWFVISTVRLYTRFLRTPAKRWRDQVFQLRTEAQRRSVVEREALRRAGVTTEYEEKTLRDQAFYDFLTGISVRDLDPYPGIGPATIAKLHDAGFTNLALLQSGPLRVQGLGGKRLGDVIRAVRDLVKQARSRFHAGACPEAQELAARIQILRASASEEGFRAGARLQAVERMQEQLAPLAEEAQNITFAAYLNSVFRKGPFSPLFESELPNLEKAIQAADDEARAIYAARNQQEKNQVAAVQSAPIAVAKPSVDLFRQMLATTLDAPAAQRAAATHPPLADTHPPVEAAPLAKQASQSDEKRQPEATHKDHLTVLEIDPAVPLSADLVRRQYNLLSERYAAEKFASAGPEFVSLAEQKREALVAAATALLDEFGEKVEAALPAAAAPPELRHNPDLDAVFGD
jgi:hypothetical protein